MSNSIALTGLVKTFGPVRALDGFDLEVEQGEVHGLLGPNGAGKSTAIRVMLGLLRADGGTVSVLDGDPWHDAVELHRRLAYVPGDVNLWPNLSGGESIDLIGRLRGGIDKRRRDELMESFKLDPTKKFRTYSKGNRQKVALVAALASDVELYIFDEPTAGLDPLMESVFQRYVTELKGTGATVLLSSHILAEAEVLCDRVSIIREGRTVESGSMKELRHLTRISITVQTERELTGLDALGGVHDVRSDADGVHLSVDSDRVGDVISHAAGFGIESLISTPPTLEELFMRHYGDDVPAQREEDRETAGAVR